MSRAVSAGRRAAGAFLLVVPFAAGAIGAYVETTAVEWALGIAVFATIAGLVAWLTGDRGAAWVDRGGAAWRRLPDRAVVLASGTALLAILLVVSSVVLRHRPLLVDSVAQVFQAGIFLTGRVAAPPPPIPAFWDTMNMIVDADGWYAQYPPGHAALLALGGFIGRPWLVPVALSIGTFAALVAFARRAYGSGVAKGTALLLLACPFFWFMGASFMNHVTALFGAALLLYGAVRWEEERRLRWLVVAGAAAGVAFLARPLTIVAFSIPLAAMILHASFRERTIRPVLAGGLAVIPFVGSYLAFNAATTGHPLVTGYSRLWGSEHGLGFHATPWGDVHTPWTGFLHEWSDLALLSDYLFEWPIPALLPLGLALAAGWLDRDWDTRLLVAFLAVPAAYFFYWHHGVHLGPRYLYVALAAVVPLTARSAEAAWDAIGSRGFPLGGDRRGSVRLAGVVLLVGCLGYAMLVGAPRRFRLYAGSLPEWKLDLVERVREAGIERGVVLVPVSWGNRIIAELHGLGASAPLVEIAYRRVDHCSLEMLIGEAVTGGWTSGRVSAEIESLLARAGPLVKTADLNGDPTLRVRPGEPLTEACRAEVRHDRAGYTSFTPHLTANDPDLQGPIVVARDLRERNEELRSLYPDRAVWIWREPEFVRLPSAP